VRLISQMLDSAFERLQDAAREVRIVALAASVEIEVACGRPALAHEAWDAMQAEINARSPQQIARMERRQGLRK